MINANDRDTSALLIGMINRFRLSPSARGDNSLAPDHSHEGATGGATSRGVFSNVAMGVQPEQTVQESGELARLKTALPDDVSEDMANTSPSPAPGQRGATIGRYVVIERLGEGGMGVVYAAFDPELNRKVAIKLLHNHLQKAPGQTLNARNRLLREAQAMAQLTHPNVITVHDVGTVGDDVFIAMEFVEGETLGTWLARTKPGWRRIVRAFVDAGRGLAAAHDSGMVHRDFKPESRSPSPEHPQPADRSLTHGFGRSGGGGFPWRGPGRPVAPRILAKFGQNQRTSAAQPCRIGEHGRHCAPSLRQRRGGIHAK